jgi:LPXTG-site transpeptidase (sortase) family protein
MRFIADLYKQSRIFNVFQILIILLLFLSITFSQNIFPVKASSTNLPVETYFAGADSGLRGDDRVSGTLNIGFSFTFYGNTYTQFNATTNGLIGFGGGATSTFSNSSLPSTSVPNNAIYGFWDDLYSYDDTQLILYSTIGNPGSRELIVQWTNYGYYSSTLPMGTFQIILYEGSNNIRMQYRQLLTYPRSYGESATIGVENSSGTTAAMYSSNTISLDNEQSILWTWNGSNNYNYNSGAAYEGVYLYKDNPPPSVPELTSPSNGAAGVSTSHTFTWNPALNADTYNLYISQYANLSPTIFSGGGPVSLSSTSYLVSTLADNTDYYWGVEAENGSGNTWSSIWSFSTAIRNSAPNDISLSNNTLSAGLPINTEVGTFSTTDPDVGDTHTYELVEGGGSGDNGSFTIDGNTLRTAVSLAGGSYTIRVRSTDPGGLSIDEAFTISVGSSNNSPTDVSLSSGSIAENQGANALVGTLSTTDPDAGDSFTYALVSGTGDTDNTTFNISGSSLRSTASLDYEAKNSYSIRVRSTDSGGLSTDKQFTITVTDTVENTTTTIISDSPDPSVFGQNYTISVSVTPASGTGTPTGTVNVSNGASSCSITLSAGAGSCSLLSTAPGSLTLTATYSGDSNWNTSSDTESHVVDIALTTTTITSDSPDPSEWGSIYSVSVSVSAAAPGVGTPTGTVTVDDGTNNCTITLASGSGSCTLPSSYVGTYTLTASYSGDTNFAASSDTESHVVEDTTPPAVTVNQAVGQLDPSNTSPIAFDVVFNDNIQTFTTDDVSFSGSTAPGTLSASIGGAGPEFKVFVSGMTGSGDVVVSIPANRVQDTAGNYNVASTSIDNKVVYDVTPPTVTIEQAASQPDPTNSEPIIFDVIFSEPVQGFTSTDITVTGMANTPSIVINGSGSVYSVEVSGVSDGETIAAIIESDAAFDEAGNSSLESTSNDNAVTYDISPIEISADAGLIGNPGNIIISPSGNYLTKFTELDIKFDSDAYNPPGSTDEDDVTNPKNYFLLRPGENYVFNVSTCAQVDLIGSTPELDDIVVPIGPVTYNNNGGAGPFIASLTVNHGMRLPIDKYRLIVCGSTTIIDLAGNPLNGGEDVLIDFTIQAMPDQLPNTGFPMGMVTVIPEQENPSPYSSTGMFISLPKLGVSTQIIGVPLESDGWNTSWLGNYAGFLEGSAFPTWDGNTVITGHIWTADNHPGIFLNLSDLGYGDQIKIFAWGQVYTYEVRSNLVVPDSYVTSVMRSEIRNWVTLMTCDTYDAETGTFINRRVVRAVLIEVDE